MVLRIPFSLMNPAATSINIFTIVRAFIFFDPRDDLCQIRVQLLSSIGNLKGYWIHYIFYVFIELNNLFLRSFGMNFCFSLTRVWRVSLFSFFCTNKRSFCNITDLLERPYIKASIEMEFILKEIRHPKRICEEDLLF